MPIEHNPLTEPWWAWVYDDNPNDIRQRYFEVYCGDDFIFDVNRWGISDSVAMGITYLAAAAPDLRRACRAAEVILVMEAKQTLGCRLALRLIREAISKAETQDEVCNYCIGTNDADDDSASEAKQ